MGWMLTNRIRLSTNARGEFIAQTFLHCNRGAVKYFHTEHIFQREMVASLFMIIVEFIKDVAVSPVGFVTFRFLFEFKLFFELIRDWRYFIPQHHTLDDSLV